MSTLNKQQTFSVDLCGTVSRPFEMNSRVLRIAYFFLVRQGIWTEYRMTETMEDISLDETVLFDMVLRSTFFKVTTAIKEAPVTACSLNEK
jgi:hypothetical protein